MLKWAKNRIGRYLSDDISFPLWFKCPNCNVIIDFNSEVGLLFDDGGDDSLDEDKMRENGNAKFDPQSGVSLHTIFCHRCNTSWSMSIGGFKMSVELDLYHAMGDNIISIAHANSDFICDQCLRVASNLFSLLESYYESEEYRNEIAEKFEEITGRNIRDI